MAASQAQVDENTARSIFENKIKILAVMDKAGVTPAATYAAVYQELNLPKNEFKMFLPVANAERTGLSIFASSTLAIDKRSGAVLYEKSSSEVRPIASLTKLMTALVFLESGPDWEETYQLQKEDIRVGGKSYIYPGDEVKVKDLFNLVLVGSDNTAAVALARSLGLTEDEFVEKMNERAKNLNLKNTFFQDISGLSDKNVSTAKEVVMLAKIALFKDEISTSTLQARYDFKTIGDRAVEVQSTDYLLSAFPADGINIFGGKTGHTDAAGYCFVGDFKNEAGREIISVVMGTNSNEDRFAETKKLVKWVYDNYVWTESSY